MERFLSDIDLLFHSGDIVNAESIHDHSVLPINIYVLLKESLDTVLCSLDLACSKSISQSTGDDGYLQYSFLIL